MKSKVIKRVSLFGVAAVFTFSNFIPIISSASVYAEVSNPGTTNSRTTVKKAGSTTEELAYNANLAAYIDEKKTDWIVGGRQGIISSNWETYEALFVADASTNTYKYPTDPHTYFTGVTVCSDAIIVGDPDELIGSGDTTNCNIYEYEERYQEVNVVQTPLITDIDLTITPPKAGTEVIITDQTYRWDSQTPRPQVSLPDTTAKYRLYDDYDGECAYWLKGKEIENYEPFSGVLEAGGKYYAEIWLKVKDGAQTIFDRDNLVVKINGETVPFEITDFDDDGSVVAIMVEVIPTEEETSSSVAAPDSGAFTANDSATPAISSAALVAVITLGLAFVLNKRNRSSKEA